MNVLGVIPARYDSSRFPGKPLALLCGKPMIQHTYERAGRSRCLTDLVVATDDDRIARVVKDFGGSVSMTSKDHASGTDRAAEVAGSRSEDIVVNIQGDEPLITPEAIESAVRPLLDDPLLPMTTLAYRITDVANLYNRHMGKVVMDCKGNALYFTRAPVPCPQTENPDPSVLAMGPFFNTVGLYGYQRQFLLDFAQLKPTPLEQMERLEQLRALEHGYTIRVVETDYAPLGVDVPQDLPVAEKRLLEGGLE